MRDFFKNFANDRIEFVRTPSEIRFAASGFVGITAFTVFGVVLVLWHLL
jgi:hypothetical protein